MIFFGHIGITLLFAYLIFSIFKEKIDYRFLIVGAILPDLIDKPIGQYIFVSTFSNGRIFGHTILFVLLLAMIALYAERKYQVHRDERPRAGRNHAPDGRPDMDVAFHVALADDGLAVPEAGPAGLRRVYP